MLVMADAAALANTISGAAWVVDGDTIDIRGERIRIMNIDALELDQKCSGRHGGKAWYCGQEAARALWGLVSQYSVTCETMGTDYAGRWFAECSIPGMSVASWMAANGWAVPNQDCACEEVRQRADFARRNATGIWSSEFEMPWEWREAH
jgi:endonuclease YncB( thermonuclease family)